MTGLSHLHNLQTLPSTLQDPAFLKTFRFTLGPPLHFPPTPTYGWRDNQLNSRCTMLSQMYLTQNLPACILHLCLADHSLCATCITQRIRGLIAALKALFFVPSIMSVRLEIYCIVLLMMIFKLLEQG